MVEAKKMRRLLTRAPNIPNLGTNIHKPYSAVEKAVATYLSEMTQSLEAGLTVQADHCGNRFMD